MAVMDYGFIELHTYLKIEHIFDSSHVANSLYMASGGRHIFYIDIQEYL